MPHDDRVATWDAEAEAFDEAADHGLLDPEVRAAWRALLLDHLGGLLEQALKPQGL